MEDYKRKYEQAIARMNKWVEGSEITEPKKVAEFVFPELKESENERIRKGIIRNLEYLMDSSEGSVKEELQQRIAWLEKQGEQKPSTTVHKFRVGDNIKTVNEEPLTITKIDDKGYWSGELFVCDFDEEVCWDLVNQKPAWSENDEKGLGDALWAIKQARIIAKDENDMGNLWYAERWLKSLKEKMKGE